MKKSTSFCRHTIAKNIQLLLDHNDIRPMDLARRTDVSPSFIGRLLKEETNVSVEKLEVIGQPFGFSGWTLACPSFNPGISQAEYDSLLELYASSSMNLNQRESIVAYSKFQETQ